MDNRQSQSILFELLRSFAALARTLNLSHAVKELNSTRQTVRRHINLLEELRGEPLFELVDRQYVLTEAGHRALPEAKDILARGQAWMQSQSSHVNGLFAVRYTSDPTFDYYQQQHPISRAQTQSSPLMRLALSCWALSGGEIENSAMVPIREYMMVYRLNGDAWYCAEIGEKSSYASWFGWAAARSSIGRALGGMPGGDTFASLLEHPFNEVLKTHGLWFDHVHTQIPRESDGPLIPTSFQRLMMGCRFPDGSFALAALVARTHDIVIDGLSDDKIRSMPDELVMNIDTISPKLKSIPN